MMKSATFLASLLSLDYSQVVNALLAASNHHQHVLSMSHAALFPEANYHIDQDPAIENTADGLGQIFPRPYGRALLSPTFLQEIQQKVGVDFHLIGERSIPQSVQMTQLVKSSRRHTDCPMEGTDIVNSSRDKSNYEPVGFLVRNTNENAYFDTDDDELCIPIVEGSFVRFDGSIPHRTVVESGHVDLLGPFSLEDLRSMHPPK